MSDTDDVTLRIRKPRITLYGVVVAVIIAWGVYSLFWSKPITAPKHKVLPAQQIHAPTPAELQRTVACVGHTTSRNVTKTLSDARKASVGHEVSEFNAMGACTQAPAAPPVSSVRVMPGSVHR